MPGLRETAREELARLRGPVGAAAAQIVGQGLSITNIEMGSHAPVLESGEHYPRVARLSLAQPFSAPRASRGASVSTRNGIGTGVKDEPTRAWAPPGAESEKQAEAHAGQREVKSVLGRQAQLSA